MRSQPMASGGTSASSRSRSRRSGRRGRAVLAPLPDPALELDLERVGDARARDRLARAAAAGSPLLAPDGRERSPVTLPEYRRGRPPANKGKRYPAEVLTGEEVAALLDAYPAGTAFGARQRALIVVMWRGALRIAEALALRPEDVDLERGAIVILDGKGAKRRVVGIDPMAMLYLQEWIAQRAALGVPGGRRLFCTISRDAGGVGRRLNSATVRESLKSYAKRAGITKRVHPHGLRHTWAYDAANEGIPTDQIRRQLGHEDLGMTQHYIDHLAPQQLLATMRARAWPGGSPPPPTTRAATSQGAPAAASDAPADPMTLALSRDLTAVRPGPHERARGVTKAEIMRLTRANGGRVTVAQLSRALLLRPTIVHLHCHELAAGGELVRSGSAPTPSGRSTNVWALPALKATYALDTHTKVGSNARPGHGPERVLGAVTAAGGRASQAQLAGLLGISPSTVATHCQLLEARGQLERGGLDKRTSNRGSRVWSLPDRQRWRAGGQTLRLPTTSSSTRTGT